MRDSERAEKYLLEAERLLHESVAAHLNAASYLKKLDHFDLNEEMSARLEALRDDFDRETTRLADRRVYR